MQKPSGSDRDADIAYSWPISFMNDTLREVIRDRNILFVYGTLKRGSKNHRFLSGSPFLGEAWTLPKYELVDCGSYPGLVLSMHGESIQGELFEVDEPLLHLLDQFEDVPNEYQRVPVTLMDGRTVQTYLYVQDTTHLKSCGPVWRDSSS
jgi:gamma-glutamylaminecyclotransferase